MQQTNCHNCGAVITGPECEYCGTRFPCMAELMPKIPSHKDQTTQKTMYEYALGLITLNEARRRLLG